MNSAQQREFAMVRTINDKGRSLIRAAYTLEWIKFVINWNGGWHADQ